MFDLKKIFIIILSFILTFVTCFAVNTIGKETKTANYSLKNNRVNLVIDAGHGGIDAGTIGVDSAKEKDINLSIALKLYDFAMVTGIPSLMIRDGDYLYYRDGDNKKKSDLYNRMDYINSIPNSTLISIHQNHFEDEREWGMQVWYSPNDDKSKSIADNILNITKENLQKDNERLNKQSDNSYYLLYKAQVPSVMVECGFMSNAAENKKLQDNKYQNDLAYSIMLGFGRYLTED